MDDDKKSREQRLAAALRANLHRRKQQARQGSGAESDCPQGSEGTGRDTPDPAGADGKS